jgi:hypothetical protein
MKKKSFLPYNKRNLFFLYFTLFAFAFLIILKISSPTLATAAEVTLQWDPSTNASGYVLHFGTESNFYENYIDVEDNLQHTVLELDENQLYYFAVSAYNDYGDSDLSEAISYNTGQDKPQILSEIIGTWSNGVWNRDVAESRWTQMTPNVTDGDISAGDFTGDGKADVASIWPSGLFYQDGATLAWTKVPGSAPDELTAGDMTGDGRFEIIGTWPSGIWYWDVAESSWTQMTPSVTGGDIAAGDFTGDGIADVASVWSSGLWYQDGATLAWKKVGTAPDRVTAGDVTGDGRSEIIGTWSNGIWYRDEAESSWTQMTSNVPDGDIAAGDFTGDRKADVASTWSSGLWYQDGATFDWTKVSNEAPTKLTAGDVIVN